MSDSANWFRTHREKLGLSLHDVVYAFAMRKQKITIGAIAGWERGHVPGISYVDDIAAVYQVKPDDVLRAMHEAAKDRDKAAAK